MTQNTIPPKTNQLNPNGKQTIRLWQDIFFFLIILGVSLKLTANLTHIVDFMFADESYYMATASQFHFSLLFRDGGIYFLWLRLLIALTPNMVIAYCLNYAILISINPLLLYIILRKLQKSPFISAFLSIFFQISILNVVTWPFVTRFSTAIILLIFILILSLKSSMSRYYAALTGIFLLVYTRPEYALSLVLFSILSIFYFSRKIFKEPLVWKKCVITCIITMGFLVFVFFVKNPAAGGRSMFAFGQHFGANMQKIEGNKHADYWNDWRELLKEKFHTDKSFFTALKNNPKAVFNHIFMNIKEFPKPFYYQLFPFFSQNYGPAAKQVLRVFIISFFLVPIIAFLIALLRHSRKKNTSHSPLFSEIDRFFYFVTFVLLIPVLVGLFVIYPRTHYMISFLGILFPIFAKNLPSFLDKKIPVVDTGVKVILILGLLFWIPWRPGGGHLLPLESKAPCTYMDRVQFLKHLPVKSDVRMLSMMLRLKFSYPYLQMYIEDQSTHSFEVVQPEKNVSPQQFLMENKINMIYVDANLLSHPQFGELFVTGNEPAQEFENMTHTRWIRIPIPGCNEYLLVNSSIISESQMVSPSPNAK